MADFQTKIQLLPTPSGTDLGQCAVDWSRNRILAAGGGVVSRVGILSGVLEGTGPMSAFGAGTKGSPPIGLDANGNGYVDSPTANYGGVAQFDGDTLALIQQWGTSSTFGNPPNDINEPGGFANVVKNNLQFMIAQGVGGLSGFLNDVNVLNGPVFAGRTFGSGGNSCNICTGMPNSGEGWLINGPLNGDIGTQQLQLVKITITSQGTWVPSDWPTQNGAITSALVGDPIQPHDVDPSWGYIVQNGICIDQTDGHLLVECNWANDRAVLKLNSLTGEIIWKVLTAGSSAGSMMRFSDIKHQRLAQISGHTITLINTQDGSVTTQTTGMAGTAVGTGAYNDSLGCMVCSGSYLNEGADSPIPLNATPNSFTNWAALYIAPPMTTPGSGTPGYARIWGNYP